jgi:probable F420-dependent oxidoreductase
MRVGAKLPNSGVLPVSLGVPRMASELEASGFASLWVSDHVVMPRTVESRYPYAGDGVASWATDDPWYDAIVALAMAAAVTESVELGTAVLVLPQRQPVVLAKQLASLDRLAGGRVVLGVGSGWLAEEFAALATPFETRGRRTDEWIDLLRACWSGRPAAVDGEHYQLPADVVCEPTPARPIPILVGGMTGPALRRARERGDGWLAIQPADALDIAAIEAVADRLDGVGRRVLRIVGSAGRGPEIAAALPALATAGITDVVVDVDWDGDVPAQAAALLAAAGETDRWVNT